MAMIETVIANLITFVLEAKISENWDELFEQMDDENTETFKKRKADSIAFISSYPFNELELETKYAEHPVYLIKHRLTDAQIVLSNSNAMEENILSSNFPELFATMKKQYGEQSNYTLYDAFECMIRDVALSPFMPVLKRQAIASGRDPFLWDKFVSHLIENKELCKSQKGELVRLFTQMEYEHLVEQGSIMADRLLQKEIEQEQIADYKGLIEEFKSLMHRLKEKIGDLKDRKELDDADIISHFYDALKGYWEALKEGNLSAENFFNACDSLTNDNAVTLNKSRGKKWKQWAADWACWLLKCITFGCVSINDYKITTDTMQIALDIKNQAQKVSQARDSFFHTIGTLAEIKDAMTIETKLSTDGIDDQIIELEMK